MTIQDTSREAYESIKPKIPSIDERIMAMLMTGPRKGCTCDTIEVMSGFSHQTASSAFTRLQKAGRIKWVGITELTRSGRKARVMIPVANAEQDGLF